MAADFLEGVYGDVPHDHPTSRAPTPMTVGREFPLQAPKHQATGPESQWPILSPGLELSTQEHAKKASGLESRVREPTRTAEPTSHGAQDVSSTIPLWKTPRKTTKQAKLRFGNTLQDPTFTPSVPKRHIPQRPSALPRFPDIGGVSVANDAQAEYAILVSMYEVYNDRIFDLLSHPRNLKDLRRRPLLFKPTEGSPDRKVVAGLRKIVCESYEEALMVLETGLMERRVAGTGSNSVSSRSHGFFCVEVKKRPRGGMSTAWSSAQLTVVDLAGQLSLKGSLGAFLATDHFSQGLRGHAMPKQLGRRWLRQVRSMKV